MDDKSRYRSVVASGRATAAPFGLSSAGAGLVGSGKRHADQLSLATHPLAIALVQFPTVTLEKLGVCRLASAGKLAHHRAGVDGQGRIVMRTPRADVFLVLLVAVISFLIE